MKKHLETFVFLIALCLSWANTSAHAGIVVFNDAMTDTGGTSYGRSIGKLALGGALTAGGIVLANTASTIGFKVVGVILIVLDADQTPDQNAQSALFTRFFKKKYPAIDDQDLLADLGSLAAKAVNEAGAFHHSMTVPIPENQLHSVLDGRGIEPELAQSILNDLH